MWLKIQFSIFWITLATFQSAAETLGKFDSHCTKPLFCCPKINLHNSEFDFLNPVFEFRMSEKIKNFGF